MSRPDKKTQAKTPETTRYVGVGFVDAYPVNKDYYRIVNSNGTTYALPAEIFQRTCSPSSNGCAMLVQVSDEGVLSITPYDTKKNSGVVASVRTWLYKTLGRFQLFV